jgi:hypothetical protein
MRVVVFALLVGCSSGVDGSDTGVSDLRTPDLRSAEDLAISLDLATLDLATFDATQPSPDLAAPDLASPCAYYVDSMSGSDTATGSLGAPLLTVDKAASLAVAGNLICCVPRASAYTVASVHLKSGVGVRGLPGGTVTFTGATGLYFDGDGSIANIVVDNDTLNVTSGTVTIDAVQFTNSGDVSTGSGAINVTGGTAKVTPGGLANYLLPPASVFAKVTGGALEIHGGKLSGAGPTSGISDPSLLNIQGGSLLLDGVTIDSNALDAIYVAGSGASPPSVTATLTNGTTITNTPTAGSRAIGVSGNAAIIVDNSTMTAVPASCIAASGGSGTGRSVITLKNGAVVEKCRYYGIVASGTDVTVDNARLSDNNLMATGSVDAGIRVDSGSLTTNNGAQIARNAVGLLVGAGVTTKLRATTISANKSYGFYTVTDLGSGQPPFNLDLGTASDPGGNTFTGNSTNLRIGAVGTTADITVPAVANTWDVSSDTDGAGHFAAGFSYSSPPLVNNTNVYLSAAFSNASHLILTLGR